METLNFDFPAAAAAANAASAAPTPPWTLVGVLASGNLEILIEPAAADDAPDRHCRVQVETSALGFGEVWRAVLEDFSARHGPALAGLRLTVHDAGATPAVVSLRLDQALREFRSTETVG